MNNINAHPLSDVQSKTIGDNTTIGQFCVILPGAIIGKNANIHAGVFVDNDVVIGNDVTIKNGVQLWDGVTIENNVIIGPNVTFANDRLLHGKNNTEECKKIILKKGASVGANATLLPGITLNQNVIVEPGAVVTQDVPAHAIVAGNPAQVVGYANTLDSTTDMGLLDEKSAVLLEQDLGVSGATLYYLPFISDVRGSLSVAEAEQHLPFTPKRLFWVFDVPTNKVRGEHAHKKLQQYLICLKGSINIVVDDAKTRKEIILDCPNKGLFLPAGVWGVQYNYSKDAVLLVAASDTYDPDDYLRDYSEFVEYVNKTGD